MENTLSMIRKSRKYHGGFSDFVYNHPLFISYCGNKFGPCGYFGTSGRNIGKDKIIEGILIWRGLSVNQIVSWLTSTDGRHLMDGDTPVSQGIFYRYATEYTKDALEKVTVWDHPEHNGTFESTLKLLKRLYPWKYATNKNGGA